MRHPVVDVKHVLLSGTSFPLVLRIFPQTHGAVDAVEVGVIGVACCDDLQWPGLACFVTEVQVDQLLTRLLGMPGSLLRKGCGEGLCGVRWRICSASRARGARRRGMPRCRLW